MIPPTHCLTLKNGVQIGYLRFGKNGGVPVFVAHGFPGSCFQSLFFLKIADELGLDVIAFDRPGYGESTTLPIGDMEKILEVWVEALAILNFQKVHVVGVSGGGPYAKAFAFLCSEKTLSLSLVAGIGDLGGDAFLDQPWFQRNLLRWGAALPPTVLEAVLNRLLKRMSVEKLVSRVEKRLSPVDQKVLQDPETRDAFLESLRRARLQGVKGVVADILMYAKWRTPVALKLPPTLVWHGTEDEIVALAMSERFHKQYPDAALRILADEGHYSLPVLHAHAIASAILQSASDPTQT